MSILLFDIGGTSMRLTVATNRRQFRQPLFFPTPHNWVQARWIMRKALVRFGQPTLRAVVGGLPGPLDAKRQRLVRSPHLPRWIGQPIAGDLRRAFHCPVRLENDGALVGLGEAVFGAGRQSAIVAYIGIGTGIGGARIVDQQIDKRAVGFEPGHQIIALGGQRCACGQHGDWEALVSGDAVHQQLGKHPRDIRSKKFWHEQAHAVAIGLVNISVLWSPDVIVLGGSMLKTPGISVIDVRRLLANHLTIFPAAPSVVRAQLKNVGGLFGALALARQRQIF